MLTKRTVTLLFELLMSYCSVDTCSFYIVWFGIRKDFYDWAVENIPILQEYFNISYNYPDEQPVLEGGKVNIELKHKHRSKKLKAPIGHIEKLDVPD